MAELKIKQNDQSVEAFLKTIADQKTREDCLTILQLMQNSRANSLKCRTTA
jgi:hypothetical protein